MSKELNVEVTKQFPDNTKFESGIEMLVSRVKHYFPEEKTPRVITLVNEVLIDKKAFYTINTSNYFKMISFSEM